MGRSTHWHILIIDDNTDDCADFRQMLIAGSSRTCHFTQAHLGEAGLQMILDNQARSLAGIVAPFDCVLLDFNLPDQNATQLMGKLCDAFGMPPCPVVVITGWDGVQADEGMHLLQAGAQDYIGKSWTTPPSLCRAVENSIDRFKLQRTHVLAKQALVKSEERYRTLFNSIDEGYCVIQMIFDEQDQAVDYRFLEVSKSFEMHTGLTDALGKTILQLIPELEKRWLQAYGEVAKTGVSVRLEDYVQHMYRWFNVFVFQFGDPANKQLGILFNNVTERKVIEGRLHEAVAEAETANRAKSEFLANMSHELRTPLNAILGFSQLIELSKPPPTPAQAQSLSRIVKAGWYLLELVNGTLDLAAIEVGKFSISLGTVLIEEVLKDCATIIAPLADKRKLSVTYPVADPAHLVHADPSRLKQVLLNVLSNSVKYNREGGSITVLCSVRAGQVLRISVRDTGLGMTPQQMEHLFEPFNRLGQAHLGEVGTGIGLVLCKRLVELMGGQIGIECAVGQGCDFWFELPLASDATLAPAKMHPAPAGELEVALARRSLGYTVLHVDHNPVNLQLVEELLGWRPQHRLLTASHGALGIEFARAHLPDVILMDLNLPDMCGTELMKVLRADPLTAHIPVIALCANAMPHDIQDGLQVGFFRYVTKPIRVHEFLDALDDALHLSRRSSNDNSYQPPQSKAPE